MPIDPGPLRSVAVGATVLLVLFSAGLNHRPVLINGVLFGVVSSAMMLYSYLIGVSPIHLPVHFYALVFAGTTERFCLLSFWSLNVLASVAFGVIVSMQGRSSTIHRKFFHLTVSLIFVSGLYLDPEFTNLCGWMLLCIFVVIEVLRFHRVPPWGDVLNDYLLVFKDEQDTSVLLTPLFLLVGVFLPLLLSPLHPPHTLSLFHLAGVASVGVGDSLAAIVGSTVGKIKWPGKKKTVEGSLAMAGGIFTLLLVARPFCAEPVSSIVWCLFTSLTLSAAEAYVKNVDNLLLPFIGYWLL